MAVIDFDVGCFPQPVQVDVEHPAERSDWRDGFLSGRRYAPERKVVRLRFTDVPPEVWAAVMTYYNRTLGGTLLMDFVPPDGGPARVVRFASIPRRRTEAAQSDSFTVDLEDA